MNKVIAWFKSSNRWKHFAGGVAIGIGADDTYCAAYTGVLVASSLELKDKLWGGQWDCIDWSLTIAGVALGRLLRMGIQWLV